MRVKMHGEVNESSKTYSQTDSFWKSNIMKTILCLGYIASHTYDYATTAPYDPP